MTGSGFPTPRTAALSFRGRLSLLARIWVTALRIAIAVRRRPLDAIVDIPTPSPRAEALPASLLSRAVTRGLRIGPWQPRCLIRSLVLYSLLRREGLEPALVIGMPERPRSTDAHSWVELAGHDVGPAPGRGPHRELTRYPRVR